MSRDDQPRQTSPFAPADLPVVPSACIRLTIVLLHWRNAGLLNDIPPLCSFGDDKLLQFLRSRRNRLCAELGEAGANGGTFHPFSQRIVQLFDNRLWRPGWGQQSAAGQTLLG